MRETCILVDGHSLMYRAFFGLPDMDAAGVPTNAVHGFLSMLLKAFEDIQPQYCIVLFDEHGPVFRHETFKAYKEGRAPMPDRLIPQFDVIREVLAAMGLGVMSLPGYEADDLIGTISLQCKQKGIHSLILTGDKDDLQLVDEDVHMLFTKKGISETVIYDPAGVKEAFGVSPEQVTDWKGLMGDPSDNIPGVPGVGEKTAVKLLTEYGSLDNVLANADNIKGKLGERLREHREQALMSRELATIKRDVPVTIALKDTTLENLAAGIPALQKYQLNAATQRVTRLAAKKGQALAETPDIAAQEWQTLASKEAINAFFTPAPKGPVAVFANHEEVSFVTEDGRRAQVNITAGQQSLFDTPSGLLPREALAVALPHLKHGIIAHHAKQLFHLMDLPAGGTPELVFDTMVSSYLHNSQERSFALQNFASRDAQGVMDLYRAHREQLKEEGMDQLYQDIELPLTSVLYDMEALGFQVDAQVLDRLGADFTSQVDALRQEVYDLTGVSGFNLNSPQQLGKVLFETLGLPTQRKTKSGYSTDAEALEAIAPLHPSIEKILLYRQVSKLNSTYIEALLRLMDGEGRIHSTFDQVGTATGRISSNDPNLQNIPVRTAMGREIRRAFVAKPGHVLIDADYSQIELRILAHMSGDTTMQDAFNRDQDIHTRTAAEINDIPLEDVTSSMRSDAKAVNFGIVYGISDFGLARNTGISIKRAGDFISRYFERYPGVKEYMDRCVRFGYEHGYIATLFGRRRLLNELKSGNVNTRNFGERIAMNTPIQGTAADIIKAAMVQVAARLKEEGHQARLVLTVHDELIIEAPEAETEAVRALLKHVMESVIKLDVPLKCDIKVGFSWYDTK